MANQARTPSVSQDEDSLVEGEVPPVEQEVEKDGCKNFKTNGTSTLQNCNTDKDNDAETRGQKGATDSGMEANVTETFTLIYPLRSAPPIYVSLTYGVQVSILWAV